ncbi:SNF2 family N-terminal domain-containing protein [Dichotomopilus funicola]|uniref:SNF2 family N-terminal domain-containing protein n=1 Tax=Dichotomopilus funicola TaxID=1934379 RepID=A0AAN6ZM80_9PEZI|nr:SNF2 family N-terminal domain-containing protein [Dichotomopilus funicola]
MDPTGNDQHWAQASKRRRLNHPPNGWQSGDDEGGQAPPPWLPAPASDRHRLHRPSEHDKIPNTLPSVQNSASITLSAGFATSYGGQTPRQFLPTPANQVGYTHFARTLPPLPTLEPTKSSWSSPYGGATSLSLNDKTAYQHPGAQLGRTSHDAMFILPKPPTSMKGSYPAGVYNNPERDTEPEYSSSISGPEETDTTMSKVVCFGMVQSIPGKCDKDMLATAVSPFLVQIVSSDRFVTADGTEGSGRIAAEHGQMIQSLLEESSIQLFAMCTLDAEQTVRRANRITSHLFRPCTLSLTIYGPEDMFEDIGVWFQEYGVYLQDVRHVHLDTKYCNPHKLSVGSIDSCPLVSDVVRQSSKSLLLEDIPNRPDLLDLLSHGDELEEAQQPTLICTELKNITDCANGMATRHQKQALTFMLHRERGWTFEEKQTDLWEYLDVDHGEVSGAHQNEEPPPFYGGIIADPMGLGKTLTMISLVATDLNRNLAGDFALDMSEETKPRVTATLIVIPPPRSCMLILFFCIRHVVPGGMKFWRHHGKTRLNDVKELDGINVVFTTYQTVSADWKPANRSAPSILFSVRWRRIILDEAHFIRNGATKMARATCELDSVSRWAVTGTPIQNGLGDLQAQLKFIRVYPYDDPKQFETDISRLWKSGEDDEAVKRLKRLSACILLRRSKATISLPARRDMTCAVDFSREERATYDEAREQTITKIDEALHASSESSRASVYVNVLQQIESLRLICDLGLHYHTRRNRTAQSASASDEWAAAAQQTFNIQREMGHIVCLQCSSTTSLTESLLEDSHDPSSSRQQPQFFRCLRFACGECVQKLQRAKQVLGCGHKPSCLVAPVSVNHSFMEVVPATVSDAASAPQTALPSKIQALVTDIKAAPADVKWYRTRAPYPSLSAARPWNPTLEEQALARIHRLGQTREVTTVRFYIRDSFEERVIELQNDKKQLDRVLLSPHDGGQGAQRDDSFGDLHKLRALL